MILTSFYHSPVLLPEAISRLVVVKGKKYIDATLGGGGYAVEIAKQGGIVLGIDRDQDAIEYAEKIFNFQFSIFKKNKQLFLERGNFVDLKIIAKKYEFEKVAGIIFDLGLSTYQIEESGRGFSYLRDEPLDMRMDKRQKLKAKDVINSYSTERLYEIFTKFSEELHSRTIANAFVRARSLDGPFSSTGQITALINGVLLKIYAQTPKNEYKKILYGTLSRIFQAIRIEVNKEIDNLKKGLSQGIDLLEKGGRIEVISYHSLEDRVVKLMYRENERLNILKIITKKPIRPNNQEILANPKARSASLRIAEKQ